MQNQAIALNYKQRRFPAISGGLYLSCLLILFLVSAITPPAPTSKIDPKLIRDTEDGRITRFMVLFSQDPGTFLDKATYSGGDQLATQLVQRLQRSSNSIQGSVRDYLDANRIPYHSYWIANMIALEGDQKLIEQLAGFPTVALLEPDDPVVLGPAPYDDDLSTQTHLDTSTGILLNLEQVQAPEVWARGERGEGAVIAIADTGVLWTHAALLNQYNGWNGSSAIHDYSWWDAIHESISGTYNKCGYDVSYPCDDYGHGTHVAGIAAGDDGGIEQIGMAPGAHWIACRNMDNGVGRPSTYIECLQFFMAPTDLNGQNPNPELRPDVINNSYTCPASELCSSHSLQIAVENVRAAGIFMSVSAGNSGPACETISAPPALEVSVFTIGAVDYANDIAIFSSRGPVIVDATPLMKPNLVAPGVSIFSSLYSGGYGYMSGTSMAAPHVSGAVALLWGAFPSLRRQVTATEALLEETAVPLTSDQGCGGDLNDQVPNNVYGWGMLNVKAAYDFYWPLQPKQVLFPIFVP